MAKKRKRAKRHCKVVKVRCVCTKKGGRLSVTGGKCRARRRRSR
jgi:hypothetical protein